VVLAVLVALLGLVVRTPQSIFIFFIKDFLMSTIKKVSALISGDTFMDELVASVVPRVTDAVIRKILNEIHLAADLSENAIETLAESLYEESSDQADINEATHHSIERTNTLLAKLQSDLLVLNKKLSQLED